MKNRSICFLNKFNRNSFARSDKGRSGRVLMMLAALLEHLLNSRLMPDVIPQDAAHDVDDSGAGGNQEYDDEDDQGGCERGRLPAVVGTLPEQEAKKNGEQNTCGEQRDAEAIKLLTVHGISSEDPWSIKKLSRKTPNHRLLQKEGFVNHDLCCKSPRHDLIIIIKLIGIIKEGSCPRKQGSGKSCHASTQ